MARNLSDFRKSNMLNRNTARRSGGEAGRLTPDRPRSTLAQTFVHHGGVNHSQGHRLAPRALRHDGLPVAQRPGRDIGSARDAGRRPPSGRAACFSPDPIARGLRLKKTGTIGLVIPDVSNPFFARIAHCVTVAAGEQGHSVLLADSQERTPLEIEAIATLLRRRVDGLIVCPVGLSDAHLTAVGRGRVPLVLVDRYFPRRTLPSVTSTTRVARGPPRGTSWPRAPAIGVLQGLPGTSNRDRLRATARPLHGACAMSRRCGRRDLP